MGFQLPTSNSNWLSRRISEPPTGQPHLVEEIPSLLWSNSPSAPLCWFCFCWGSKVHCHVTFCYKWNRKTHDVKPAVKNPTQPRPFSKEFQSQSKGSILNEISKTHHHLGSTHRIHVCYIYLSTFSIKINHSCRCIYHTWILWGTLNPQEDSSKDPSIFVELLKECLSSNTVLRSLWKSSRFFVV